MAKRPAENGYEIELYIPANSIRSFVSFFSIREDDLVAGAQGTMRILQNSDYMTIETSKENKFAVNKILCSLNFEKIDCYKSYTFWRRIPK